MRDEASTGTPSSAGRSLGHGGLLCGLCLVALALWLPGCVGVDRTLARTTGTSTPGGETSLRSLMSEASLTGRFDTAIYANDGASTLTMVLTEGPVETTTQAMVIRLLWVPRSVETPRHRTATNITVHYVVFAGEDEVGIFEGAGFMLPLADPGDARFRGRITQASVRLVERSERFADRVGPSVLTGGVLAEHDEAGMPEALRRLSRRVHDRLGYPRLILDWRIEPGLLAEAEPDRNHPPADARP
ncbi:MAG: hypothetical protein JJU36_17095 [Phycisphaeraceae bacterium]|nr:hypothetical protein [Phycisphaeraceae bacterium]